MQKATVPQTALWGNAPELIRRISAATATVERSEQQCQVSACKHCGFKPEANESFKLHACRERCFFVVDGPFVRVIRALLSRWRCPDCSRTFTEYPDFAVPYRRYTISQMRMCALAYTSEHKLDYRSATQESQLPILHLPLDASKGDGNASLETSDRILTHSSLFHWVTFIAEVVEDPPRTKFEPAAVKYRSWRRRAILMRCFRALSQRPAAEEN